MPIFSVRVSCDKYLPDYPFFTVFNDIEAPNETDAHQVAKEKFLRIHITLSENDPFTTYVLSNKQQ